jgi:chromosomal replication initiator protein
MLDLLIIDDVQEFAGKVGTQDTFFAIFNSLHQSGKQIILTCDTMPSELKGLNDRLLSRFRWGLTAEVSAPDFQTRLNILKKKVYNDGMEIPDDILEYIAHTVVSNVRELEGTLISLLAASTFTRCDLTLETAQNLLGKIVRESDPEYSVDFIVKTVCEYFGIKESVLSSKSRAKDIATARQLSMYFSKQFTGLPYKTIGEKIGGRDHSTVLHACKAVAKSAETDPKFKETVCILEEKIKEGEKN